MQTVHKINNTFIHFILFLISAVYNQKLCRSRALAIYPNINQRCLQNKAFQHHISTIWHIPTTVQQSISLFIFDNTVLNLTNLMFYLSISANAQYPGKLKSKHKSRCKNTAVFLWTKKTISNVQFSNWLNLHKTSQNNHLFIKRAVKWHHCWWVVS